MQPVLRLVEGAENDAFVPGLARAMGTLVSSSVPLVQAMMRGGVNPARSIYVVFTTAEESGLLGSEYFVAHPPLPMTAFAANINVDGANYLGPTRDIVMLGSDRSSLGPLLTVLATARGRVVGQDTHPERGYFFRSDHFPLAKAGVPALSLSEPKQFEGSNAEALLAKQEAYIGTNYHQPSDEYDPSWDFSGAAEDMKLLTALVWQAAAAPSMPAYNEGDQFAQVRTR